MDFIVVHPTTPTCKVVYDIYNLLNANADTIADDVIATFNSKVREGGFPWSSSSLLSLCPLGLQVWLCGASVCRRFK